MFYIYLTILLILDLAGLSCAKLWGIKNNLIYLIACIISYAVVGIFLALSLKYEGATITNIIWVALSAIGMTAIGYFLFHERITIQQFIGIGIIIIGLVIIQYK